MDIKSMKTAIIGCGVISHTYIQNLQQKFRIIEVVACYDRNEEKMKKTAEEFHIKAMQFEEILKDKSIELLINLTTPKAHYTITRQALEAGKHVFSEKMIAVELEEGKELLEIAERNQVRLGVAPDTFLGSGIQTARYIVEKGLIGEALSAVVSVNRNFRVFADILPHMNQRGGSMAFDVGCYYMTALASILGPAEKVTAFSRKVNPVRTGERVDRPWLMEEVEVEEDNLVTAVVKYKNGVLCTVHFNSESIMDEQPHLEIYGTEGIVFMGDPNEFGSPVYLKKELAPKMEFPATHGYKENSRGLGAAELAWAVRQNRQHRAGMEMAYHVFELIHGMYLSAKSGQTYIMQSDFQIPKALKTGYKENGFWGPTEESALIFS